MKHKHQQAAFDEQNERVAQFADKMNRTYGSLVIQKKRKIVINISQEVFDYIAKNSLPLVDSPDSTLRRLFGLPPKKSKDQT